MTLDGALHAQAQPEPPATEPAQPGPVEQQAGQRHRRRRRGRHQDGHGEPLNNGKPAEPQRTGTVASRLLTHIKRTRHRAALLDHLAAELLPQFVGSGTTGPSYLIEDGAGNAERTDPEAVLAVAAELHGLAERERAALRQLLSADVATIELPAPDADGLEVNLTDASVTDAPTEKGAKR